MNTKKTIKILSGLALAGCFLITQPAAAQSWGSYAGTDKENYIINQNNSNHWTYLRLQTSDDRAWNMVNQEYLWWGYAPNGNHSDQGTERMRLTNDGRLTLTKPTVNDAAGVYFAYDGNAPTTAIQSDRNFGVNNDGGLQLMAHNTRPIQFFTQNTNSAFTVNDEVMRISGDGNVGIGTTTPAAMLDVAGTSHFGGNVGIGTTTPAVMLDVAGTSHFGGNVGIGISSPERSLHVRGNIIRIDRDAENPSVQIVRYAPDYATVWKTFELYTEGSDVNEGKFIIADRGTTTGGAGATPRLTIDNSGNIGIGTTVPAEKMEVVGMVKATSFTSSAASFPDYVFAEDYELTPLSELESYVKINKRLPNMPSEKEVVEEGLNIPGVITKSVENIETIYLHLIRMEKKIEALEQENVKLKQQLKQGR